MGGIPWRKKSELAHLAEGRHDGPARLPEFEEPHSPVAAHCEGRAEGGADEQVQHGDPRGLSVPWGPGGRESAPPLAAAHAATPEERNPVSPGRKIHRPKLPPECIEPDLGEDMLDGMDVLFKQLGDSLRRQVEPLGPRNDIIEFDSNRDQPEIDGNIRWVNCPDEFKPAVTEVVKKHWDVFAGAGLRRNIRGFSCRTDTGNAAPMCCRPPRHGPHEPKIMDKLAGQLEPHGMIEDDDGPWGSQVVLAGKPGQAGTPMGKCIWRFCVSCRRVNQMTRAHELPVPRCDDAVDETPPWALCFLTMGLDAGHWQVTLEKASRPKTAFFTPSGKKRWTVMPMGALNSHAIFVAMMSVMRIEWNKKARPKGILFADSKVMVDDILAFAKTVALLLQHWECMLPVPQFCRAAVNLRKCRFLDPDGVEFVGIDTKPGGNSPARSKQKALRELTRPETWAGLGMLIGAFGFHQRWTHNFEIRIAPFRRSQAKKPKPGSAPIADEKELFAAAWDEFKEQHDALMNELREDTLPEPVSARPDPDRPFCLKTDWSKDGMGAALLQAEDTPEARAAEETEQRTGVCLFDKTRKGMRLKPTAFISRRTTASEKGWHSCIGEAAAGRWSMQKFKKWLLGRRFSWLADCSGLKRFFKEGHGDMPRSMMQRWRMELLQFEFDLCHRPADMLTECNMLSRCNLATEAWRQADKGSEQPAVSAATPRDTALLFGDTAPSVFATLPQPQLIGDPAWPGPPQGPALAADRSVVAEGCFATPLPEASAGIGLPVSRPTLLESFDDRPEEGRGRHLLEAKATDRDTFWRDIALADSDFKVDWCVASHNEPHAPGGTKDQAVAGWTRQQLSQARSLVTATGLRAATLWTPARTPPSLQRCKSNPPQLPGGWSISIRTARNTSWGGAIETDHEVMIAAPRQVIGCLSTAVPETAPSSPMDTCLDVDHGWIHDAIDIRDLTVTEPSQAQRHIWGEAPGAPVASKAVNLESATTPIGGFPAFDPRGPAPSTRRPRPEEALLNGPFGVWFERSGHPTCRPARLPEVFRMLGADAQRSHPWLLLPPEPTVARARAAPGVSAMAHALDAIQAAENRAQEQRPEPTAPAPFVDPTPSTAVPLPAEQQWKAATAADHDLSLILQALRGNRQLAVANFSDKGCWEPFQADRFEEGDGALHCCEQAKVARLRQLRVRAVPPPLRRMVFIACHSSPLGGHSGLNRTRHRLQTRHWWPGITRDTKEGVASCAHCNLSNAVPHESQLKLSTLSCDEPFDVVLLDFWSPGKITDKRGNVTVLTHVDNMSGFAMGEAMRQDEISTESIANVCLPRFWATAVGLPRLAFAGADPLFCDVAVKTLQPLQIPVQPVSRGNHKAALNENFHRCLNKVERTNTADTDSQWRWQQGAMLAFCAWSASPVDGTDIPRSQAAVGRALPLPIDLSATVPRTLVPNSQEAADHFEAAPPLLLRQRQLLGILDAERRRRHNELRNQDADGLEFQPGNSVLARKQVKSKASENFAAKSVFKTRGPCRVIERVNPNSCRLQKLPLLRGLGRPGRPVKENAARMTLIPSTLIFHKMADGADTRMMSTGDGTSESALERWLGVLRRGACIKATDDPEWALEPLQNMWSDEVPDEDSEGETRARAPTDKPTTPPSRATSNNLPSMLRAATKTNPRPTPQLPLRHRNLEPTRRRCRSPRIQTAEPSAGSTRLFKIRQARW